VWERVRAAPGFQEVLGPPTLEFRIQHMLRVKRELLGGWDPDSITEAIHFEHTKAASDRRKGQAGAMTAPNTEPAETVPYLFRFEGAVYRVRFENESGTIDASLRGAGHIFELLQHPHKFYSAAELARVAEAADSGKTDQAEHQDALRKLHDRLAELQDLDPQSPDFNSLNQEREDCLAEVRRLTGLECRQGDRPEGKARRRNPADSARVAVARAIERVLAKCRADWGLAQFADHLNRSLERGADYAYRPAAPSPDWHF
jgi:hypothetical protein